MSRFAVRPLERKDIPRVIDYWMSAGPAHLIAMGADIKKVPSRTQWQANLEEVLSTPERKAATFYLIWLVDGRPIGSIL